MEQREQLVSVLMKKLRGSDDPEVEIIANMVPMIPDIETAIRIIQKNERGRQQIIIAQTAEYNRKQKIRKRKTQQAYTDDQDQGKIDRENAMDTIRKYYRGYCVREQVEYLRQEELLFLGLDYKISDPRDKKSEAYKQKVARRDMKY